MTSLIIAVLSILLWKAVSVESQDFCVDTVDHEISDCIEQISQRRNKTASVAKTGGLDSNGKCSTYVQSAPLAYYGFPYNLTFTTKLPTCDCLHHNSLTNNLGPFSYCMIHNYNIAIPKKKLHCNLKGCYSQQRDITYNVGLAIENVTSDNIGMYTFVISLNGCKCTIEHRSSINLTAQTCIEPSIRCNNSDLSGNKPNIICEAYGNPRPKIQWKRCDTRCHIISSNSGYITTQTSNYSIRSTLYIDRENYRRAENISVEADNLCKLTHYPHTWIIKQLDADTHQIPGIYIGLSIFIGIIVSVMVVLKLQQTRRNSINAKVTEQIQHNDCNTLMLIHGYGAIPDELINTVKAELNESPFRARDDDKIRIWDMNSSNGKIYSPQVYYENISYFNLVIFIYKDGDPNTGKLMQPYKDFKFYMESIVNNCCNEMNKRGFIVICVDSFRNLPKVLLEISKERWSHDMSDERKVAFKIKLARLIESCAKYINGSNRGNYDGNEVI